MVRWKLFIGNSCRAPDWGRKGGVREWRGAGHAHGRFSAHLSVHRETPPPRVSLSWEQLLSLEFLPPTFREPPYTTPAFDRNMYCEEWGWGGGQPVPCPPQHCPAPPL